MTWLDIVILVVCALALARGLKTGLIMQIASLLGIVLGAIFAGKIAELIYPYLLNMTDNLEHIIAPISYLIGFILILLGVNLIGKAVHSLIHAILLGPINRIIGGIFCLTKWVLIMSILLNLTVLFDRNKSIIKEEVRHNSYTYSILSDVAQAIIPFLRLQDFSTSLPTTDNPQPQAISV